MILIDTSAWIEFLRETGSMACERVDAELSGSVATCEPVQMELLAGARDARHLADLRGLLARYPTFPAHSQHWEEAARLYRSCRAGGDTVRKLIDCLIAAVAIESDLSILHHDTDFDVLARHTNLVVVD